MLTFLVREPSIHASLFRRKRTVFSSPLVTRKTP